MRRLLLTFVAICLMLGSVFAPAIAASGTVNVLYAGSLVGVNENIIGPAFHTATGYSYAGQGLGSIAIASEIKAGIATPDVVEFADPAVNALLMGKANGSFVKWYITYGRSQLVVGYDPAGRFARAFAKVENRKLPWYKPLEAKGFRLGRTDPQTDPKGYRTLFAFRLAQKLYHLKHLASKVLGSTENPAEVYPEQVLVSRLLTGEVDAGIFYLSEVKDVGIPYITLPKKINFGDPKYSKLYATQSFKNQQGQVFRGSPIYYTVTIPRTVKNEAGAVAFVKFVLGRRARALSSGEGLLPVKPTIHGDKNALPPGV